MLYLFILTPLWAVIFGQQLFSFTDGNWGREWVNAYPRLQRSRKCGILTLCSYRGLFQTQFLSWFLPTSLWGKNYLVKLRKPGSEISYLPRPTACWWVVLGLPMARLTRHPMGPVSCSWLLILLLGDGIIELPLKLPGENPHSIHHLHQDNYPAHAGGLHIYTQLASHDFPTVLFTVFVVELFQNVI